jgi:hypothetical protein
VFNLAKYARASNDDDEDDDDDDDASPPFRSLASSSLPRTTRTLGVAVSAPVHASPPSAVHAQTVHDSSALVMSSDAEAAGVVVVFAAAMSSRKSDRRVMSRCRAGRDAAPPPTREVTRARYGDARDAVAEA